ncbi:MFS transporter [Streptomyces sp. NPDC048441]|uniref:MFS transporter n=1 Tax=Streptomyces sp. NPDC048441 TaxID=3365552 RepID=UPI0037144341
MDDSNGRMDESAPHDLWWRRSRFPLFAASRALSLTGDMAATTALTVHIYAETESGLAVSGLFAARVVPRLVGMFAGAVSDRVDLRRVMVVCDVISCLIFFAIASAGLHYIGLLLMVLVAESAATVASPAAETVVARVAPPEARGRANGVMMAILTVSFAVGSAAGSLTAGMWGYEYALLANSATFLLSAAMVLGVPPMPPPASDGKGEHEPSMAESVRNGLRELRHDLQVLLVTVGMVGVTFGAALDRTALVALAQDDLGSSGIGYGLALGAVGFGALIGTATVGRVRWLDVSAAVFIAGVLMQAGGHLVMGLAPVLAVLVAAALFTGYGNGLEAVTGTTLLQGTKAKGSIGMLMGVVASGSYLANAVGSVAGGALVGWAGPRPTFVVAAALMAACGWFAWRAGRGPRTEPGDDSGGRVIEKGPPRRKSQLNE